MTEDYRFSIVWQELDAAGVPRDHLKVYVFTVYATALEQHERACRGLWVSDELWPEVTSLVGQAGGRSRHVRTGRTLWVEDRPPMTAAEFTAHRRATLGDVDGRAAEVSA